MTILEIIEPYRQKRLANVPYNFEFEHICPQCGVRYLCPDRYDFSECNPASFFSRESARDMMCLPCSVSDTVTDEERKAWNEAHALTVVESRIERQEK